MILQWWNEYTYTRAHTVADSTGARIRLRLVRATVTAGLLSFGFPYFVYRFFSCCSCCRWGRLLLLLFRLTRDTNSFSFPFCFHLELLSLFEWYCENTENKVTVKKSASFDDLQLKNKKSVGHRWGCKTAIFICSAPPFYNIYLFSVHFIANWNVCFLRNESNTFFSFWWKNRFELFSASNFKLFKFYFK